MAETKPAGVQIDELMEEASQCLVRRDYFASERACVAALGMALATHDYHRAARIILPLEECRRQKRDLAVDAGVVTLVFEPMGESPTIKPGTYIFCPPRVAQEARQLRELADAAGVPIIVFAREPVTRSGLVPLVAVGPTTFRAYVEEPPIPATRKPTKKKAGTSEAVTNAFGTFHSPTIAWVLAAAEALGDAALAEVNSPDPLDRIDDLWLRLQAFPNHEKLHQALRRSCEDAARIEPAVAKSKAAKVLRDEEDFSDEPDDE